MKKNYLSLLVGVGLLTACAPTDNLKIKQQTFTYELGEIVSTDVSKYLVDETDKAILDATTFDIVEAEKEKVIFNLENKTVASIDSAILNVGTYEFILSHKNEVENIKITVEDTTKPEFKDFKDKFEITEGDIFSFNDKFTAEDLSKVDIKIDGEYDTTKAGNYTVKVTATDEFGNAEEKEATLVVKAKSNEIAKVPSGGNSNTANGNQNNNGGGSTTTPPSNNNGNSNSGGGNTTTPPSNNKPSEPNWGFDSPDVPKEDDPITDEPPIFAGGGEVLVTDEVKNSGMVFDHQYDAWVWAEKYCQDNIKTITSYLIYEYGDKYTVELIYR